MSVNKEHEKEIAELQEILRLQKTIQDITNSIHAAQNIREIIADTGHHCLGLFEVEAARIYVCDRLRNDLYTLVRSGARLKEVRISIDHRSIPGYVAATGNMVNIADAFDREELRAIDRKLNHDIRADEKSCFRTRQVMAIPILYNNELLGVIEVKNIIGRSGTFKDEKPVLLKEIAEALGIAIHNQQRMSRRRKTRFEYLVAQDLIKEADLDRSWSEARKMREPIEDYLMKRFKIDKVHIGKSLEEFYRCSFILFDDRQAAPENLLKNLRQEYLRRELWVPFDKADGKIRVLVDDPNNILKRDTIESLLRTKAIEYCVALKEDILKYIDSFYRAGGGEESISDILGRFNLMEENDEEDEKEELVSESDSVIMQLVNKIIYDAITRRASDIHIEPSVKKKTVNIRFRIDGDCVHYMTVPYSYRAAAVSRLKIMSNLDITERRLPQDGKIKFKKVAGELIELRLATIPTQGNVEDVVMRILAKGEIMTLDQMSLSPRNYEEFLKILAKPYGIILVVGPTGSGKTTTLHAALHRINTPDMKIWTAEDPVEITQEGLRQVQVNPKIGFEFSHAMRAFLRSDPDVIMVGEMRDYETAKIGVEASLTGHLVFSTLHTNSAPETVVRLLDIGIDPFNFADSLLGILAQRLVRTLCKKCKVPYHPSEEEFEGILHHYGDTFLQDFAITYSDDFKLFKPKGCSECNNTGYRGRIGVHELLVASDQIKRYITKREPVELIRETAISEGMRTLLQDGISKVINGLTDFKQVLGVCIK